MSTIFHSEPVVSLEKLDISSNMAVFYPCASPFAKASEDRCASGCCGGNAFPYGWVKAYALPYSRASDWGFRGSDWVVALVAFLSLRSRFGLLVTPFITVGPLIMGSDI